MSIYHFILDTRNTVLAHHALAHLPPCDVILNYLWMTRQFLNVNNLERCPNTSVQKGVNGARSEHIAVLYGSYLDGVIIHLWLREDERRSSKWLVNLRSLSRRSVVNDGRIRLLFPSALQSTQRDVGLGYWWRIKGTKNINELKTLKSKNQMLGK